MQATARMASIVSSTLPARRRLIRNVRPRNHDKKRLPSNSEALCDSGGGILPSSVVDLWSGEGDVLDSSGIRRLGYS